MKHLGTKNLKSAGLILRRFKTTDAKDMFSNWASDAEATRYLTWLAHKTVDETQLVISSWIKEYDKPTFYHWTICLKDGNVPIGSISVVNIGEKDKVAEISYCIGNRWCIKDYPEEALHRVIAFLFKEVGIRKVYVKQDVLNTRYTESIEKCGLKLTDILPSQGKQADGTTYDLAIYEIIKKRGRREKNKE